MARVGAVGGGLRMLSRAKSSAVGDIRCILCVIAEQFNTCFKTVIFFFSFLCVKNLNAKRTPLGVVNN